MSKMTQYPCPVCSYAYTKGTSTMPAPSGTESRRKRTCMKCGHGFVTYEIVAADYQMLQHLRRFMARPGGSHEVAGAETGSRGGNGVAFEICSGASLDTGTKS